MRQAVCSRGLQPVLYLVSYVARISHSTTLCLLICIIVVMLEDLKVVMMQTLRLVLRIILNHICNCCSPYNHTRKHVEHMENWCL